MQQQQQQHAAWTSTFEDIVAEILLSKWGIDLQTFKLYTDRKGKLNLEQLE